MTYVGKIKLDHVKCGGCFSSISQMIYQEDIKHLDMDHARKIATITFEDDKEIIQRVIDRINQSKYKAELVFVEEE